MKFIITLFAIIIVIGCSFEQSVNMKIKPSDVGYDVYAEDGELLLEFTDKDELHLLRKLSVASSEQSLEMKPIKEGYSFCRHDGDLIIEIIKTETNEEEMELLKYIYEVSLEYKDEML